MMRTPDSLSMCSKPLICWQRFDQVDFGSRPWILPDPAGQRDGAVAGRQIAIQRT
jgi:hypothetical protein